MAVLSTGYAVPVDDPAAAPPPVDPAVASLPPPRARITIHPRGYQAPPAAKGLVDSSGTVPAAAPPSPAPGADQPGGEGPLYTPPAPSTAAPSAGAAPGAADAPGGEGEPYVPPPPSSAPQISASDAAGRGAFEAISLGAAPAIAGLSAASGMVPDAGTAQPEVAPGGEFIPTAPVTAAKYLGTTLAAPVVGGVRLAAGAPGAAQAYTTARQAALEEQQAAEAQHPYSYLAGQLGGGLATIPFTGGAGGGASVLGRIGRAAGSGALYGGAYGAGEATSAGGSALDVAKGAGGGALAGTVLGGALGSAAEGVAHLGGRIASVVRGARNPEAEAKRIVQEGFAENAPEVAKRRADTAARAQGEYAGTPVSVVDYGGAPSSARLRSAANRSPTAREMIGERVGSRYRQQSQRFAGWLKSKFGSKDTELVKEGLKSIAQRALDPLYKRAYAAGSKGVINDELRRLAGAPDIRDAIENALRPMKNRGIIQGFKVPVRNPISYDARGVARLTQDANGNEILPDLAYWDQVVRNLNGRIGELLRNNNKTAAADAIQLKNALLQELDTAVPEYKAARGGAHMFFNAEDAIDAGANFVTDANISDVVAARAVAGMNKVDRELFRIGFANQLSSLIESRGDRTNVLDSMFIDSPRARRRIEIALGADGAAQFEALKRVEVMIDRTRMAMGNSTTAQQAQESGLSTGAGVAGIAEALHGAINPIYIIAGGLMLGGRAAARNIDEQVAVNVAKMLLSDDPALMQRGLEVVSGNPTLLDALRVASRLTTAQIVNVLRPSGVAAGGLAAYHYFRPGAEDLPPHDQYNPGNQDYQAPDNAVQP